MILLKKLDKELLFLLLGNVSLFFMTLGAIPFSCKFVAYSFRNFNLLFSFFIKFRNHKDHTRLQPVAYQLDHHPKPAHCFLSPLFQAVSLLKFKRC
ncbi:hypothetical protein BY996DRAFT_2425168 [Phakopsora pachyrhizi]|nr:hypothetical protein BY996DRAFT_2425168 [Phakopsora pachyrhizi]